MDSFEKSDENPAEYDVLNCRQDIVNLANYGGTGLYPLMERIMYFVEKQETYIKMLEKEIYKE